jgi:hypothetical protein
MQPATHSAKASPTFTNQSAVRKLGAWTYMAMTQQQIDQGLRIGCGILLTLLTGGFLLPTGIAIARNRPDTIAILLWNTFGSFLFFIGWVVALIKAVQS